MIPLLPSDLLLMWAISLLYVMWKTHSFKSCMNLTIMVTSLFVISLAHRLFSEPASNMKCMFLVMGVATVLVWREVPKVHYGRRRNDFV